MIRLSKLADYAIILLGSFTRLEGSSVLTARELSETSRLPLPTVSKILKMLSREGILASHRGTHGGYHLSRPASDITMVEIITAMEGPIAMTECSGTQQSECGIQLDCPMRTNWQRINHTVLNALEKLTLQDMQHPLSAIEPPRGMVESDPV